MPRSGSIIGCKSRRSDPAAGRHPSKRRQTRTPYQLRLCNSSLNSSCACRTSWAPSISHTVPVLTSTGFKIDRTERFRARRDPLRRDDDVPRPECRGAASPPHLFGPAPGGAPVPSRRAALGCDRPIVSSSASPPDIDSDGFSVHFATIGRLNNLETQPINRRGVRPSVTSSGRQSLSTRSGTPLLPVSIRRDDPR